MSTTPPAILNLANQLLARERGPSGSPHGDDPALRVCGRLRVPLVKLIGVTGFVSLLTRALVLAKRQAPTLEALRIQPDGSLVQDESHHGPGAAVGPDGAVLVGEFLGLLVTFIGQPLTLTLLREVWPDASTEPPNPNTEGQP